MANEPGDRRWLTVDEVAARLRISRALAYDQIRRGLIPSVRFGRLIRIPTAGLEALERGDTPLGWQRPRNTTSPDEFARQLVARATAYRPSMTLPPGRSSPIGGRSPAHTFG